MNKGLRRSFAHSFIKHQEALKSFLMRRGVRPEDCEDIVQETFLRCYPLLQKNPEGDYRGLFITVARNLHVDAYRRNKRYARDCQPEFFESIPDASEQRRDRLQRALIERMVDTIQDRPESRCFKLHYQNGYKIHEIAAMTQIPKGTVSSQIYRFRQRVQATLCEQVEAATELLA